MLCQVFMWKGLVTFFTNDCPMDTLVDMVGQFTDCSFPITIIVDVCAPSLELRDCSLGISVGEEFSRAYGFVIDGAKVR